jgi:hypothetical protein
MKITDESLSCLSNYSEFKLFGLNFMFKFYVSGINDLRFEAKNASKSSNKDLRAILMLIH